MNKKKWPSREMIARVTKKIENDPDLYVGRTQTAGASEKDRIKYGLCSEFVKYVNRHKITQRELAKKLKIDEALVSKIVRYHIEEFSLDRLYDFLNILDPHLTLKVERKGDEAA